MNMDTSRSTTLPPLSSGQTVVQVLQKNLICCEPQTSVQQAASLMRHHNISCILVKKGELILWIWTKSDCKKLDLADTALLKQPVSLVVSCPVLSVPDQSTTSDAAALMKQKGVRRLLVTEGVETQAQQEFLLSAGCQFGQGYWVGKAQDPMTTLQLLRGARQSLIQPDKDPITA